MDEAAQPSAGRQIARLQEQQMFVERDVERMEERTHELLEQIRSLDGRIARLEGHIRALVAGLEDRDAQAGVAQRPDGPADPPGAPG